MSMLYWGLSLHSDFMKECFIRGITAYFLVFLFIAFIPDICHRLSTFDLPFPMTNHNHFTISMRFRNARPFLFAKSDDFSSICTH